MKVKAHRTGKEVAKDPGARLERYAGNNYADRLAARGAEEASLGKAAGAKQELDALYHKARLIQDRLAAITMLVAARQEGISYKFQRQAREPIMDKRLRESGHRLAIEGGHVSCWRCGSALSRARLGAWLAGAGAHCRPLTAGGLPQAERPPAQRVEAAHVALPGLPAQGVPEVPPPPAPGEQPGGDEAGEDQGPDDALVPDTHVLPPEAPQPLVGRTLLHRTHALRFTRGIWWCGRCGAYTSAGLAKSAPRKLGKVCGPLTPGGAWSLGRLRSGRTPRPAVLWPLAEALPPAWLPEGPGGWGVQPALALPGLAGRGSCLTLS